MRRLLLINVVSHDSLTLSNFLLASEEWIVVGHLLWIGRDGLPMILTS